MGKGAATGEGRKASRRGQAVIGQSHAPRGRASGWARHNLRVLVQAQRAQLWAPGKLWGLLAGHKKLMSSARRLSAARGFR